jgi:hypothetical protein
MSESKNFIEMKKVNYFSSFFAALAVFFKIYRIMKQNNLSFRMLTHIKEVDAEKKVKKIIAIFQEDLIPLSKINEEIRRCESFYQRMFDRSVILSGIKIPEQKIGMNRLYIMIPNLSIERILAAEKEHFIVDAPNIFSHLCHERDATNKPYAFWGSDSPEADSQWKNKSGRVVKEAGVVGQTLKERLIQGFMHWDETGEFFDKRNTTICTGTQNMADEFPTVDFGSKTKGVCVDWIKPGMSKFNMSPREIAC